MKHLLWPSTFVSIFVLAQGENMIEDMGWPGLIFQFGALGVLAGVIWYIIGKHLPKMMDTHTKELAQRDVVFTKALEDKDERMKATIEVLEAKQDVRDQHAREDSSLLRQTLQDLQNNCSKTRDAMREVIQRPPKRD